jgi:hypothetical protein
VAFPRDRPPQPKPRRWGQEALARLERHPLICGHAARYELCDLNLPEPEQIHGQVASRLVLLALRHIFDPLPKQALREILPLAKAILDRETALEMLEVLLRYYVQTTQQLEENDIRELLAHPMQEEEAMQTFIDRYIEQGRQQGWFKGIE